MSRKSKKVVVFFYGFSRRIIHKHSLNAPCLRLSKF